MKHLFLFLSLTFTKASFGQLANGSAAPDWTLSDLNGNSHTLYNYLNQGKVVVLDFSAAWCSICWNYHNTKALENFYQKRGPSAANYQANVFFVESEANNNTACLSGQTGCTGSSRGNWLSGSNYPFIDNAGLAATYKVAGYPTIYMVCPNKSVHLVGQLNDAQLDAAMLSKCGVTPGATNVVPLAYSQGNVVLHNCFGEQKGSISITATGGQSPYTYSWSGGKSGATINNLAAGSYTCTVTDSKGTKLVTTPIVVTASAKIVSSMTIKDFVACGEKGEVKLTASGGTGALSYAWNNGGTTATLSNLTAGGTFVATISDTKGCKAVSESAIVKAFTNKVAVAGDSTATITCVKDLVTFNPTTIAGDYSFVWKDAKGATLGTTISLNTGEAGKYVFSVKDNKSLCVTTKQYEVKLDTTAPKIQFGAIADLNCNMLSVVLAPTVDKGANFSYSWEYKGQAGNQPNFSTAAVVTVTNIGVYTLTVENKLNGCLSTVSKTVQGYDYPKAKMILNKPLLCNGDANAEIAVSATDGKPPYQYFWSNGIAGFSFLGGFGAGEVGVTVTDANGCKSTSLLKVTAPEKLVLSYKSAAPSSGTAKDGMIDNSIFGGTPPYSSVWKKDGVVFGMTQNLKNLGAGSYQVTVTDANGCTASFPSPIVYKSSSLTDLNGVLSYSVSPNPVLEQLNVRLSLVLAQPVELYLTDVEGRLVSSKQYFSAVEIATWFDTSTLPKGVYFLVTNGNGNVVAERILKE